MTTEVKVETTVCPYCKKEGFETTRATRMHVAHCPEFMLGEGPTKVDAAALALPAQPASDLAINFRVTDPGPALLPESIRSPESRTYNVTHAWYFTPGVVDVTGISTTGMPRDMLLSSPSWQQHQKQEHIDAGRIPVQRIERHGLKVGGSPYVHLLPPDKNTWAQIVRDWKSIIPSELAIEQDMLEQAEMDLVRALTPDDRFTARGRIRVLSTRVAQMRDLDFDRIFQFFVDESNYSRLTARSSAQTTIDLVNETVDQRIGVGAANLNNDYFDGHSDGT